MLILGFAGPERGQEPSGEVLRLIQIRLATPSLDEITPASQDRFAICSNRRFEFNKRSQPFIRTA